MRLSLIACALIAACGGSSPPAAPPPAPTGLTAAGGAGRIALSWAGAPAAESYKVLRGTASGAETAVATATSPAYTDTGLPDAQTFFYVVQAVGKGGTSANSNEVSATTAPTAPGGLGAVASNHHVALGWTAAPNAGPGGYRVLRSPSADGPLTQVATTTATSFTDTFLANGTTYFYRVRSIGSSGDSLDSNLISATPFIELCAVDGASQQVSVYDGTATGNVPPLRTFGWQTGIADGTGIASDGTTVYVASRLTHAVNLYPRAVAGNTAPTSTLALSGEPTALALDTAGSELFVAVRGPSNTDVIAFSTPALTEARRVTVAGGSVTGLIVAGTQLAVLDGNTIALYDRASFAAQNVIQPGAPVTANTKLFAGAYDAADDAIWVAYTTFPGGVPTGHASSYPRLASGAAAAVKNIDPAPSFPMNFAQGMWLDVAGGFVWISVTNTTQRNADALYKFARATGVLQDGIVGPATLLYQPGAIAFDAVNGEQWVVNGRAGALAFRKTDSANIAPRHFLDGRGTGVFDPVSIARDQGSGEIVLLNRAPTQSLTVYPRAASGAVTPSRTLAGPNTTLDAYDEYSLAVDEGNGEYWVSESRTALAVFGRAQAGDVAPLRPELAGTANFNLGLPSLLAFDATAGAIVAVSPSSGVANQADLQAWHRTDTGDVAAAFDGTFALGAQQVAAISIDPAHDELFVSDGVQTSVFPRAFQSGPLTALRTLSMLGLPVADGEGDELYFWSGRSISAVPRTSSGTASPSRTLSGLATALYDTRSLAICN